LGSGVSVFSAHDRRIAKAQSRRRVDELKEVKIDFTLGDEKKIEHLAKLRDGKETRPINVGLALESAIRRITVKYKKKDKDKVTLIAYGREDD
jgi:hypothetical protein